MLVLHGEEFPTNFPIFGDGGTGRSDQPAPDGERRGLAPVGDAELAQNVADVVTGGLGADEELVRNLRIGQTLTEEAEDLLLAPGQGNAEGLVLQRHDRRGRGSRGG